MATNVVIKFRRAPMKIVGEIELRNFQLHMVLCYGTLYEVWLNSDENCWTSISKIVESEILQSALTSNQTQPIGHEKYPMCTAGPRIPNFHLFRSMIIRFRDIPHFRLPIDFHVKISKCHIFLKLGHSNSLYSTMVAKVLKVWLTSDEKCRSTILKFSAP